VRELSQAFDAYWNSAAAVTGETFGTRQDAAQADALRRSLRTRAAACAAASSCALYGRAADKQGSGALDLAAGARIWAGASLHYDSPDQDKSAVASGIEHGWIEDRPGGARTHRELLIVSPYFVLDDDGLQHLADMRRRGVRIAVLTNSLSSTDSLAAHSGYARQRVELLLMGVELFEMRPQSGAQIAKAHRWLEATAGSLHAKVVVQDRERAIVGSLNQDPRSRLYNSESWLNIDSAELAAQLAGLFAEASDPHHAYRVQLEADGVRLAWHTEESGQQVVHALEPASSPWLKLWRALLGVLVPDHLL
jgi:putative cardiolipin synthase